VGEPEDDHTPDVQRQQDELTGDQREREREDSPEGQDDLARLEKMDFQQRVGLAATVQKGGQEIIVGFGEYAARGQSAEIAFVVADGWHRRGIASRLLRQLTAIARANGITQFEADVLVENTPMLAVFRNSGLRMRTSHDRGVVQVTLFLTGQAALRE